MLVYLLCITCVSRDSACSKLFWYFKCVATGPLRFSNALWCSSNTPLSWRSHKSYTHTLYSLYFVLIQNWYEKLCTDSTHFIRLQLFKEKIEFLHHLILLSAALVYKKAFEILSLPSFQPEQNVPRNGNDSYNIVGVLKAFCSYIQYSSVMCIVSVIFVVVFVIRLMLNKDHVLKPGVQLCRREDQTLLTSLQVTSSVFSTLCSL